MNRGFFVVFFMYFFVIQSAIFGMVRGETTFNAIGLISLVFIVLMALFYVHFDKSRTNSHYKEKPLHEDIGEHASHQHSQSSVVGIFFVITIALLSLVVLGKSFFGVSSVSVWPFAALYFIMLFLSAKKLLAKKISLGKILFAPKDFLSWLSLILVVGIYGALPLQLFSFKLFLSLLVGFIFFFIGAKIVQKSASSHVFSLFFTRAYLIVLVIIGGLLLIQNSTSLYQYRVLSDWNMIKLFVSSSFVSSYPKEITIDNALTGQDSMGNGSGQVLSTNLSTGSQEISGNDGVDVSASTDVLPSPQVGEVQQTGAIQQDDRLTVASLPTMMDVLIYLMDHYAITLSSKKDIKFTYVTPKNPYYPQFRTAYDMKLIGYATNPSKHVLCETYIVMKGIVEERNISSSSNIISVYWKEAASKDALNGCKWGFYVKNVNL